MTFGRARRRLCQAERCRAAIRLLNMKTIIEQLFNLQRIEMGPSPDSPDNQKASQRMRKGIPDPILAHYDRLLARGKAGVALVRHGVCTTCHMKLATGLCAELFHAEDIRICDTCGRYLLLAPEERAAQLAPKPEEKLVEAVKAPAKPRKRKAVLETV